MRISYSGFNLSFPPNQAYPKSPPIPTKKILVIHNRSGCFSQLSAVLLLKIIIPMDMGRSEGDQHHKTLFSTSNNNSAEANTCDDERKIIRRDNERQRRQQMASLNSSLRSLLPLEMIKGKRSVSDHMQEAVNYINYLKNKIEALKIKRDELKSSFDLSAQTTDPGRGNFSSENCSPNSIIIRPCLDGIEIVISSRLALSRVLEILPEEGLNIVRCASTRVNGRLIHNIQSEVEDPKNTNIDLSELQQKLYAILCNTSQ